MAEAGAGAKIMDNSGAEKEPEAKINNFGSTTLKNVNRHLVVLERISPSSN